MGRKIDPDLIPAQPNLNFENAFWQAGIQRVGGIDEAGRGALAGPVVAAVVILPPQPGVRHSLVGVRDSKVMTPNQREKWRAKIQAQALAWSVGFASPREIDAYGIVPATRLAAQRALDKLSPPPEHLLLDYLQLPNTPTPQTWLVKGDARSLSIAAASVLAKTIRDEHLRGMEETYPGFGFASHKGYGTKAHRQAIQRLGPSPIHRMSFAPMKLMVS
ncbi:MAG: Ribonuclease HII [Chloroflexi bacterium]|nr:Ribonuclease HII [Chloroflexota bacterium]